MKKISMILHKRTITRRASPSNLKYEFQVYGQWLAQKLEDMNRESLYMKLAKEVDRSLLEQALWYVMGAHNIRNKGAMFMYKLKQLRQKRRYLG